MTNEAAERLRDAVYDPLATTIPGAQQRLMSFAAEPTGATTNTMDPYCGCDAEGHEGPCATAALDVERLARAVPFMLRRRDEDWPTFARKVAAAIAAAYEGEK